METLIATHSSQLQVTYIEINSSQTFAKAVRCEDLNHFACILIKGIMCDILCDIKAVR